MEIDLSKQLYQKYFKLTNRLITVTLKNGTIVSGVFISFCKNESYDTKQYITKWLLLNEHESYTLGIDDFGCLIGLYIQQNEIAEILFHADNSTMKFIESNQ